MTFLGADATMPPTDPGGGIVDCYFPRLGARWLIAEAAARLLSREVLPLRSTRLAAAAAALPVLRDFAIFITSSASRAEVGALPWCC